MRTPWPRSTQLWLLLAPGIIAAGWIGSPDTASASRTRWITISCPLGGQKFESRGGIRRGRAPSAIRLDGRPLGRYAEPEVPRKCPNGFVIFKDKFYQVELAKLKPVVFSSEYQALQKKHAHNFLAAFLMKRMGASTEELTSRYLRASWETEGQWPPPDEDQKPSARDRALVRTYREAALRSFEESFAKGTVKPEAWWSAVICAADLDRLLGHFDQTEKRLAAMPSGKMNPSAFEADMITQIKKYAAQKDSEPHEFDGDIPDIDDTYEDRSANALFPMNWVPR